MEARPHPKLRAAEHGTRFPGALLAGLDGTLPRLPVGFDLDRYRGEQGELRIPLARGRISWVRRVDEDGGVWIAGQRLRIPRAANEYVVATLSTARREAVVRLWTRLVSRFAFPLQERVVQPLRPSIAPAIGRCASSKLVVKGPFPSRMRASSSQGWLCSTTGDRSE